MHTTQELKMIAYRLVNNSESPHWASPKTKKFITEQRWHLDELARSTPDQASQIQHICLASSIRCYREHLREALEESNAAYAVLYPRPVAEPDPEASYW